MKSTLLAIESSCDETAVAVLRDGSDVLSHVVASQVDLHAPYGGVVPELASRSHLETLPQIVNQALSEAAVDISGLDAIAATTGPGLAAALLVGSAVAKGLALGAGLPFISVDHVEGHLLSPFFGDEEIPPHVGLIVSGGHTLLVDVHEFRKYEILGGTRDDASGEAFDKVAKLLNLGYPGGVQIEQLAIGGNPERFAFPRSMIDSGDFQFSFSGLKTSVRYFLGKGIQDEDIPDVCAGFQEAIVDVLAAKLIAAARQSGHCLVALSGGVSANRRLQDKVKELCLANGLECRVAPRALRTDNALMIAHVASRMLEQGIFSGVESNVKPNFDQHFASSN